MLKIDVPQSCSCRVWRYMYSHSMLSINAFQLNPEKTYYLLFTSVEFYEGPLFWEGADYQIGSSGHCLDILHRTERFDDIPDAHLSKSFKLFVFPGASPVRIIAANVRVFEEDPLAQF